ncbi:MAG TPA: DUF2911 domain-containing protein [Vicinamibacteria bacterium]
MMKKTTPLAAALALATASLALAGDEPTKGPRETVGTTVGGKKVTIEYGRPPLTGQTVDEIMSRLPEEKVWRAGVDRVTTFETEGDVVIAGQKVPAGKYTLYAHVPAGGPWSLLVSSDQGAKLKDIFPEALEMPEELADQLWPQLGLYEKIKAKEVARAPLKKGAAAKTPVERFQITLGPETGGAALLTLAWGEQSWTAEIKAAK